MPKYKVGEETYNIPEEEIQNFLTAFPEAEELQEAKTPGTSQDAIVPEGQASATESKSEDGSLEQPGFFQNNFGKNPITNFFDDIGSTFSSGFKTAKSFDETREIMTEMSNASNEKIDAYYKAIIDSQNVPQTDEGASWNSSFDKNIEEGHNGLMSGIMATFESPLGLLYEGVKNLGMMLTPEALPAIAGGAAVGAGAGALTGLAAGAISGPGAALTAGGGAITGSIRGAIGGLSAAVDTYSSFTEILQDELGSKNLEFNPQNIKELLKDEDSANDIRNKAIGRGLTVGVVDAMTMGLAGKAGSKALGATLKSGKIASGIARVGTQQVVESTGGALGEVAGRVVADQEMDSKEIFLEAFAGTGVLTQSPKALKNLVKSGQKSIYLINGKQVERGRAVDFITTADPKDIAGADIKIKNDKNLYELAKKKQDKYFNEQTPEKQKEILEKKKAGEKQQKEEKLNKSIDYLTKFAEILKLPVEVVDKSDDFWKRIKKERPQGKEGETVDAGGVFQDGTIIINKEGALNTLQLNVGAHEILHPILNAMVGSKKEQVKVVNEFKNTLTKAEQKDMEKIMNDRGYTVDNGNYHTEYLNVFSDAVVNDELSTDKTLYERIAAWLQKVFGEYNIEIGFEKDKNGNIKIDQVKNFMKKFNESAKSGAISQELINAIDTGKLTPENIKLQKEDTQFSQQTIKESLDKFVKEDDGSQKYEDKISWQYSEDFDESLREIKETPLLDASIRNRAAKDGIFNVNVESIKDRVINRVAKNFDPTKNDSLFGYILGKNSILEFAYRDEKKSIASQPKTTSIDKTDDEGNAYVQLADEDAYNAWEEEDISVSAKVNEEIEEARKIDPIKMLNFPDQLEVDGDVAIALKMTQEEVEAYNEFDLEHSLVDVDLSSTTLANTPRIFDYAVALTMGINPKKIFSTKITLTSKEADSSQKFIYDNIKQIISILPEGATDKATGKAADVHLDKGMHIPRNLLRAFYTKNDRKTLGAGLYPFKLNSNIDIEEALAVFGMDAEGKPLPTFSTKATESQSIKALATLLSKLTTNTELRKLAEKTDSDPMIILNLAEGKSDAQFSVAPEISSERHKLFKEVINNIDKEDSTTFKNKFGISIEEAYDLASVSNKPNEEQVFDIKKVAELKPAAISFIKALPFDLFKNNKGVATALAGLHHRENMFTHLGLEYYLDKETKKFIQVDGKLVLSDSSENLLNVINESRIDYTKDIDSALQDTSFKFSKELENKISDYTSKYPGTLKLNNNSFIETTNKRGKINVLKKVNDNNRIDSLFEITNEILVEFFDKNRIEKLPAKERKSLGVLAVQIAKGMSNITDGVNAMNKIEPKYIDLIDFHQKGEKLVMEYLDGNTNTAASILTDSIIRGVKNPNTPVTAILPESIVRLKRKRKDGVNSNYKRSYEILDDISSKTEEEIMEDIAKNQSEEPNFLYQFSFNSIAEVDWEKPYSKKDQPSLQSYNTYYSGNLQHRKESFELRLVPADFMHITAYPMGVLEHQLMLEEGSVRNGPNTKYFAFADEESDATDLTEKAKDGRVNQYQLFGEVTNAVIKLVKDKNVNAVMFTAEEESRKSLYSKMSRFISNQMGWSVSETNLQRDRFGVQLRSYIVYDEKAVLEEHKDKTILSYTDQQVQFSKAKKKDVSTSENESRMSSILSRNDSRYTSSQTIDKATARNLAATRRKKWGKIGDIIAPSADDFVGLLYRFLAKGKLGEEQYAFFEDKLIKPFSKAYYRLNSARQVISKRYKKLKDENPKVVKRLKEDSGHGGFTMEQALRVWMFNKAGFTPAGLNEDTLNALVKIVKKNPDIEAYGNKVANIAPIQEFWVEPDPNNWQVDTLQSDVVNITEKIARKQMLAEWINNKDEIFSDNNMNKIEATYGGDFRHALEDMLYRMEHGTARPEGINKQMNQFLNWIRGSVAVTMFLNTRSAILQQISMTNFINWGDNNPVKAAAAFANQAQYWKDWAFIFNSDYLKERRGGLKTDVNAADLAEAMKKGGLKSVHAKLLQFGFSLTQIGDSVAISSGGATFLRNRIKTYTKQGMSAKAAEKQAFLDFQEISEETQQSARPDRLAKQQTDVVGRVFLAFQNTPMQYTRLITKAAKDLIAGRGDMKTNVSKIVYYMAIQNIIFSTMQQALFSFMFRDDDDDLSEKEKHDQDKKIERIVNNSIDTIIRGTGMYGAVLATAKNTILKFVEQEKKQEEGGGRSDHAYTLIEMLNISPPVGIKARQMYGSIQNYRYNKDVIDDMGASLYNPALDIVGSSAAFTLNVPLDRGLSKVRNLAAASDAETETWAKIALALGWNTWNVGIENDELQEVKLQQKKQRAINRKSIKKSGGGKFNLSKSDKKKSGKFKL